jgi:hypothetical protein
VFLVIPAPSRLVSDVLNCFVLLFELKVRMRRRIYLKKVGHTRCHRLWIVNMFFEAPPDLSSLPTRAATHAIQAALFGTLPLQPPLVFSRANVCTKMASSSRLHFVDVHTIVLRLETLSNKVRMMIGEAERTASQNNTFNAHVVCICMPIAKKIDGSGLTATFNLSHRSCAMTAHVASPRVARHSCFQTTFLSTLYLPWAQSVRFMLRFKILSHFPL